MYRFQYKACQSGKGRENHEWIYFSPKFGISLTDKCQTICFFFHIIVITLRHFVMILCVFKHINQLTVHHSNDSLISNNHFVDIKHYYFFLIRLRAVLILARNHRKVTYSFIQHFSRTHSLTATDFVSLFMCSKWIIN